MPLFMCLVSVAVDVGRGTKIRASVEYVKLFYSSKSKKVLDYSSSS